MMQLRLRDHHDGDHDVDDDGNRHGDGHGAVDDKEDDHHGTDDDGSADGAGKWYHLVNGITRGGACLLMVTS